MKKNSIFGLIGMMIIAVMFAVAPTSALACHGPDCRPEGSISGSFSRDTAAFQVDGEYTEKKGTITLENGAMAGGSESSSGKYKGSYKGYRGNADGYVIGGTAGLGGTFVGAYNTKTSAMAYGITGNLQIAGIGGHNMDADKSCISVKGKGEMFTVAIKERKGGWAVASTEGKFKYSGQANKGVVIGGGATGGFSAVNVTANTASAVSGGFTASGVGNIGAGGGGPS